MTHISSFHLPIATSSFSIIPSHSFKRPHCLSVQNAVIYFNTKLTKLYRQAIFVNDSTAVRRAIERVKNSAGV